MTQMQRQLAAVPISRRRRAVGALALLAVLLLGAGVLPWASPAPSEVRVMAVAALVAGVFAGLIAWGLARSVSLETRNVAAAEFEAMIAAQVAGCDCGHDHGADAHVEASSACRSGSADPSCQHDCAACVLSQLR